MNYIKRFLPALVALFAFSAVSATVRTVNNAITPINPGQYSTIAAAISAASNGDTILVAGSTAPYESATLTINKRLVIIGAGYNPKGATAPTRIGQDVNLTCLASGSTIMGFIFDNQVSFTAIGGTSHRDITFARNYFAYPGPMPMNVDSVVNNQFINNIWGNNAYVNYVSAIRVINTHFYNNVFLLSTGTYSIGLYSTDYQNIYADHNLFLYGSRSATSVAYSSAIGGISLLNPGSISFSIVTNNIFYNCAAFYYSRYTTSTVVSNNITYTSTTQPTLPYGSIGTGNINNTNPLMTTLFSSSANPYLDFNLDNLNLQSGSPCINAGSDGTNIGPTGGLYPIYNTNSTALTGEPPLPSVRSITVTGSTTVPAGTPLNVTLTGKKLK